ncbi:hypothetical protein QE417_004083 [Mucilaginibacter terrae]|uniref:GmrSD restriction endonucleases C-terminal domain-containing protein n=1 Tax=Mucilaginibacter terrae TaxID=1955052 RepID=A0ABU3GZG4_9SPHI|nr:HNH endonuclease family protein [Mucilaginibacter terrae]MDT3405011.1 hypothetical protein [Mucilaginibacter terrae]
MVKNYLTKNIKAKNSKVDLPKDKWGQIRDNIDSTTIDLDIDTFLLHVWLSKYDFTTTKTLFKKLKNTIKPGQAKSFLDDLLMDSEIYKSVFDTQLRKWNRNELPLKSSLDFLSSFKVTQQTPMVLSIMREFASGRLKFKYAKEGLEAIEHFHYIFTAITSQRSSGGIASMYSTFARELYNAKDDSEKLNAIRELKGRMREKLPTYDEFLASFRTLKFTNNYTRQKRILQYTLGKIDRHFNSSGVVINYEQMTLEHIAAQSISHKPANYDEYVGTIGNLIFIDQKTNNDLANRDFAEKIKTLIKSSVFVDDTLKSSLIWEQEQINQRTEDLAKLAFTKVFKI